MNWRGFLLCVVTLTVVTSAWGQSSRRERRERRVHFLDSVLTKRYYRGKYDTAYIRRPDTRFTIKVRANTSGSSLRAKGSLDGEDVHGRLTTEIRGTISGVVSFRGLSAGLSLNPGSLSGRNKDYEFNFNNYTNRYGFEISYQMSKTLNGDMHIGDNTAHLSRGSVDMEVLSANGYYAFNGRRFSFPAAFTQNYIQCRSAGSWLVGFSYIGSSMKSIGDESEDRKHYRIYIGHLGIGGGYGYNFVLHDKWLLHLSTLPTLVISNRSNITVDGERQTTSTRFPDLILTERLAVVRDINRRYYMSATLLMNNSLFGNRDMNVNYNRWHTRFSFGFRL